ncbi:MAG TPA: MFS transporter [Rubricoccaceae bacterium]|nr:MFS transporter [Rubricoccaceae bacterium]
MEPPAPPAYRARTIWAWALYDFANSAFTTLVVTFVYATYFTKALAENEIAGTALWSRGITVTAILVAVLSPLLGAYADRTGTRKRFFLLSSLVCVVATVGLFFPVPGEAQRALALFVIANVAFELGNVFYNAFLPEIAPPERIGRVSGYGWALGYVGGLIALVLALYGLVQPETPPFGLDASTGEHVRATNLLVAGWFALFALPAFFVLREVKPEAPPGARDVFRATFGELGRTFREVRRFRQAARFLLARLFYNDGLNTIFAFGGIYAAGTFGFTTEDIIVFGIALNVAAGLGAYLFGFVDDRLGGKTTILLSLVLLTVATALAVFAPNRTLLWVAGLLIGVAAGPNQAASRSLLGRFVPPDRETEFYGFFAVTGKLAAFLGPLLLGAFTEAFDSQRAGVATVLFFFLVGGLLLLRVDEREGIAAAGRGPNDAPVLS